MGNNDIRTGLTFSDVLLVPKRTPLNSRSEANTKTNFTKNIEINVPLVSSNMATVTEHKMAIAMAREGGIGVIHQFSSIEDQVEEVKRVKRSTSFVIEDPITIKPNATIYEAIDLMERQNVTSLLVMSNDKLVGIFTSKDYLFEDDMDKKVSDVMTGQDKLITSTPEISTDEAKDILQKNRIEKLPLVNNDGHLKGLITTKDIKKMEYWPEASRDNKGRLMVAAAVGVRDSIERTEALVEAGADVIVIDLAHGHSDMMINSLKELKSKFDIDVMVGNIATKEAAKDLIEAGADGLKVGIGPSRVCSTRIVSGAGVPQFTAVKDVCEVANEFNIPVCADGGAGGIIGNVTKALALGAGTYMSGSFYAGTDEAPGIMVYKDGRRYKRYIGSASYESVHERKERSKGKKIKNRMDTYVEGVSNLIEYKGPVEEVIKSIVKGIQSGMSYCGARSIQEMQNNAEFIRITSKGWRESKTRGNKLSE